MSIVTRTGDDGTTGLMYNRRTSKCHPQVEAYGTVDELSAALGLARATAEDRRIRDALLDIQQDLVPLMGELATHVDDLVRYRRDGFPIIGPEHNAKLDRLVAELEKQAAPLSGWATPGQTPAAATLDWARTTCRRAERRVWELHQSEPGRNSEVTKYLNRLGDALWLMARRAEQPPAVK